ncbi:putative bifunctional diguanylate cyclase/phosphodiesterase [Eionea flava]
MQSVEPPKRVLLVDDDRQQFLLIGYQLSAAHYDNYRLLWCQDLEKGLKHIENQDCDVVLLDYHWGINCADFIQRANTLNSRVPVIVMTDDREKDVDLSAISDGASDYLVKENVNSEVLERSIRYAIERKKVEHHLDHLAHYDHLTDLPNRALFLDRLTQMLGLSQRSKHQFTLMYIDLNKFKEINDSYGHHIGDDVLVEFSRRLKSVVRRSDTVARIGGDEFTVILNNVGSTPEIIYLAQKIIDSIQQPFFIADHELNIGCSIGIAVFPDAGSNVELLQRNADLAMYEAKQTGTSTYRFFLNNKKENTLIENISCDELRDAVEKKSLVLRYTPRFDLQTNRIIGVVVSPVINHKTDSQLDYATFASLIENTESIRFLTEWMIRSSMEDIRHLYAENRFFVAYSVRRTQLQSSRFSQYVQNIIHENNIDPKHIEFSFLRKKSCKTDIYLNECIDNIINIGAKIGLSDYGENTFGLSNLKKQEISCLHFSSNFLSSTLNHKKDNVLLETLILLAHRLGKKVVINDPDNELSINIMRSIACDFAQGGVMGKDLTLKEFSQLIREVKTISLSNS